MATLEGTGENYLIFTVDGYETTIYFNEDTTIRLVPEPVQIYEP